jgi:hypothetical protein
MRLKKSRTWSAGRQCLPGLRVAQLEFQRGGVFAQQQVAAVQVEQGAADLWQVAGHRAQFAAADIVQAQVAQGLAQRFLQRGGLIDVEKLGNVAQHLAQLLLHGRGQRTLVALDLVQVAGRQPERPGKVGLAVAALLAQLEQAQADLTESELAVHRINRNRSGRWPD